MFIGVTGTNCSGKTTVVQYLKEKGYEGYSLSDILREEATLQGMEPTIDNLVKLGNEMRAEFGAGILAERTIKSIVGMDTYDKIDRAEEDADTYSIVRGTVKAGAVIESIRNPGEVKVLRKYLQTEFIRRNLHRAFYLISVDAPAEMRLNRFNNRKRADEMVSLEDFIKMDERSAGTGQPESGQQLKAVMDMANYLVINKEDNLAELHQKIESAIKAAKQYKKDVYYMGLTIKASSRSDCIKRCLGAVIVREDGIITTGFNGSPRGLQNCNEGGCERCADTAIPSGEKLDRCTCVHAEQNAILRAAYLGANVNGSTIYTSLFPCVNCAKEIVQAGINRVVYAGSYPQESDAAKLFEKAGIKADKIIL